jgi:nicotinamidase-related amidase
MGWLFAELESIGDSLWYNLKKRECPMKTQTALLIIDVQTAMFTYETAKLFNEQQVLDNLIQLIEKARSSQTPVIFIQHTSFNPTDEFYKGSPTWGIYSKIAPQADELVIEKTTWDAFYQTRLEDELQKLNIRALVIAGMQTEFCLDTTCRSAFSKGYANVLVEDAHSTFDGKVLTADKIIQHHNQILGGRFAELKKTNEFEFSK